MSGGFDYSQFKNLYEGLVEVNNGLDQFKRDFLLDMGRRFMAKTVPRTPVDSGTLRESWELSDVHTYASISTIILLNATEYALYVEKGHMNRNRSAWVEGYFMATTSLAEMELEMPKRWTREFNNYVSKTIKSKGV